MMLDPQQNSEVKDEAIREFRTESLAKHLLTHCWHKLQLKIASKFFAAALQTWISKTVHSDHIFGCFLFLVLVNVMTAYLYHSGNKKYSFLLCAKYALGWVIKSELITGALIPIFVLKFNLYGIICTVRTLRCNGLLFVKGNCLAMHHNNYIWMLMRPHKFGFNYLHGRDWALHQFLKYIHTKKSLKFAVLDLFGAFSAEMWLKQKLNNTSCPCYEIKKFTKLTVVSILCCHRILPFNQADTSRSICISLIEWENSMTAFTTQL